MNRNFRSFIAVLSCFVLLTGSTIGNTSCSKISSEEKEKENEKVSSPIDLRDGAVSLNGKWDFYADTLRSTTQIKSDTGIADTKFPLCGHIYGMELTIKNSIAAEYVKARANLYLPEKSTIQKGQNGYRVGIRANGKEWAFTDVRYYMNNDTHWIDLSIFSKDLIVGKNNIEICTTLERDVYLMGNSSDDGKAFENTGSNVVKKMDKTNLCIRLKSAAPGTNWQSVTVPGAYEGQFSLSFAETVYPGTFDGIGWYRKDITIQSPEKEEDLWLCFDAVDYKAEVWLNGHFLGSHEGGYTSFDFCISDVGDLVNYGKSNTLVVRAIDQNWNNGLNDDDINIKETLAGFSQDTRGLNYGGIWQNVYLEPRGNVRVDDLFITTDPQTGEVKTEITLWNSTDSEKEVLVTENITEGDYKAETKITVPARDQVIVPLSVTIKNPHLWNAHDPWLYTAAVTATCGDSNDKETIEFGIRSIKVNGSKIELNGENIFLTGMLHWGSYYDNFTSAVSVKQVEKEITELKKAGFNAIKYCLVSPPDYVLDVCDRMGMYVYIEYPIWNPKETSVFFERCYLQLMEMVIKDRIHPSVIMSDFNCEDLKFSEKMDQLMKWCVTKAKTIAPNRLYTDNSSNGEHKYGDFATCHPYYQVNTFETMLKGWITSRTISGETPLILGEYADISVLRDLKELNSKSDKSYTWYHDTFKDIDQAEVMRKYGYNEEQIDMVINQSVQNAQELRKYYLEASKSNAVVGGLFLTHISESPNGWADGWFDDLGEPHFDPDYIKQAASETTLLFESDTVNYWAGDDVTLKTALSLYGGENVKNGTLSYTLSSGNKNVDSGIIQKGLQLKNGDYYNLNPCTIKIPKKNEAVKYLFTLTLKDGDKVVTKNSWNIWGYPKASLEENKNIRVYDPMRTLKLRENYPWMPAYTGSSNPAPDLIVTTDLSGGILNYLTRGGTVVYVGSSGPVKTIDNWDFNRFSFAFLPDMKNILAGSLKNSGYGGLQFLELATAKSMEYTAGKSSNIIGRYETTNGKINSFMAEYKIGQGTLLQTTLRLNDKGFQLGGALLTHESLSAPSQENVLGEYLLEQMIRYELEKLK